MPTVRFVKQNLTVECPVGTNLRELALANEIDLYAFPANLTNCRGHALCGTCRVRIDETRAVSARGAEEEKKVGWEGPQVRLACRTKVLADIEVVTNPRKPMGWTSHTTYKWMEKLPY
jgi:ferredoxin